MLEDDPKRDISLFASSIMPRFELESEGDRNADILPPISGFELRLGLSMIENGLDFL